jgi:pyruvate dehydrogenase (quinone)
MSGDPKFEASQDIPDFDYARYAELCGLHAIRVERPEEIAPAWQEAFTAHVPTVIDALASPDVPPIPPHIEWKEAKALMSALMAGDPNTTDIVRQASKQSLLDLLPGRG